MIRYEFRSIVVQLLGDINILDDHQVDSLFDVLDSSRRKHVEKLDVLEFKEIFRSLKRASSIQNAQENAPKTLPKTPKSPSRKKEPLLYGQPTAILDSASQNKRSSESKTESSRKKKRG
jgi:hypothetical protein